MTVNLAYRQYFKEEALPLMWCAGCGNGILLRAITDSLADLQIPPHQVVVSTGIGCWGKADDYMKTHAFHGSHGRALAFGTGIKLGNPDLHVIALMGDGDALAIGGNHFIHAARRNIDITAIISNNFNYGMTGGQYSPTTPLSSRTTTSPVGVAEPGFDVCALSETCGANYVARSTVYHVTQLKKLITAALQVRGFSVVEALNTCPTHFGRRNIPGDSVALMKYLKDITLSRARYDRLSEEERENYLVTGELVKKDRPDYLGVYRSIHSAAGETGSKGGKQ